jgi:hypothetical protein
MGEGMMPGLNCVYARTNASRHLANSYYVICALSSNPYAVLSNAAAILSAHLSSKHSHTLPSHPQGGPLLNAPSEQPQPNTAV